MVQADGARDVVEGPQHARHIAQREVRARALGHRTQRLALEIEKHPPAPRHPQHLAQVVVAVDALQPRPLGVEGLVVHGFDRRAPLRDRGDFGDGDREAAAPRGRCVGVIGGRRLPRGEEFGERHVDVGSRHSESPCAVRGSPRRAPPRAVPRARRPRHPGGTPARRPAIRSPCPGRWRGRATRRRPTRSSGARGASRRRRGLSEVRCRDSGQDAAAGRPCR